MQSDTNPLPPIDVLRGLKLQSRKSVRPHEFCTRSGGCIACTNRPLDEWGYIQIGTGGKRKRLHRHIHELLTGEMRADMMVLHSCGNAWCCNPQHLRWGTGHENSKDKIIHGTHLHILTHSAVLEIFESKATHVADAKKHGVSPTTICKIRNGKKWSWLTGAKNEH